MKRKLVLALLAMTMITSTVPVAMPVMAYASDDVQAQSETASKKIDITVSGMDGVTAESIYMNKLLGISDNEFNVIENTTDGKIKFGIHTIYEMFGGSTKYGGVLHIKVPTNSKQRYLRCKISDVSFSRGESLKVRNTLDESGTVLYEYSVNSSGDLVIDLGKTGEDFYITNGYSDYVTEFTLSDFSISETAKDISIAVSGYTGVTADEILMSSGSVDNSEDGSIKMTTVSYDDESQLHLHIPASTKPRILTFDVNGSWGRYGCLYVLDGKYSRSNPGNLKSIESDGTVTVDIGASQEDFYILDSGAKDINLSNFKIEEKVTEYSVGDNITAKLEPNGVLRFSGTGEVKGTSSIPSAYVNDVKKLVFDEGITAISKYYGLDNVQTYNGKFNEHVEAIQFPSTLEYLVCNNAFKGTNITELKLPAKLRQTGVETFANTKIKKLTIPASVTSVSPSTFAGCKELEEVRVEGVNTKILDYAFSGCTNLKKLYYNSNESTYHWSTANSYTAYPFDGSGSTDGVDIEFGPDVTTTYEDMFKGISRIKSLKIPDTVTTMNENTFRGVTDVSNYTTIITTNQTAKDYIYSADPLKVRITDKDNTTTVVSDKGQVYTDSNNYYVNVGSTIQLKGRVPDKDKNYTWLISNADSSKQDKVASINENGLVTGLSEGWAIVSLANDDNVIVAQTTVAVVPRETSYRSWITNSGNLFTYGGVTLNPGGSYGFGFGGYTLGSGSYTSLGGAGGSGSTGGIGGSGSAGGIGGSSGGGIGISLPSSGISSAPITNNDGLGSYDASSIAGTEGLTVTGTVHPVTTMDISIPLNGITFTIDEDRNFHGNVAEIKSNCIFPLDVVLMNITGKTADEPEIVLDDTYTDKQWNNLSRKETNSKIALSLNDMNLTNIYNNGTFDDTKSIKVGELPSAYDTEQVINLTPSAKYGKNFGNKAEKAIQYDLVVEFRAQ